MCADDVGAEYTRARPQGCQTYFRSRAGIVKTSPYVADSLYLLNPGDARSLELIKSALMSDAESKLKRRQK